MVRDIDTVAYLYLFMQAFGFRTNYGVGFRPVRQLKARLLDFGRIKGLGLGQCGS